jgi:hypothetical protein
LHIDAGAQRVSDFVYVEPQIAADAISGNPCVSVQPADGLGMNAEDAASVNG